MGWGAVGWDGEGLGGRGWNRTYFNAVDELKVAQVTDPDKGLEKGTERETDLDIHKFGNR